MGDEHAQLRMRTVEVVEYDPRWPGEFERESRAIAGVLTCPVVAIHHIGSTSVPGLCAKPIIDLLLVVARVGDLDGQVERMAALGYLARGELGIPGRRYFSRGIDRRTHHVHAFAGGDANVARHLAFRDYLRQHPAVMAEYGELKRRVASSCGHDIEVYMDGKDPFIKRHEVLALAWWRSRSGG